MKILLLFPRWTREYGIFAAFARKASTWPPLNLAYLAAIAERKGHEVMIIDGEAEGSSPLGMARAVNNFNPDLIGMTATTPFYHIAVALAKTIKRHNKKIPMI